MDIFKALLESRDTSFEDKVLDESEQSLDEANYVKLDSATKRKRLLRQATLLAAKEANDPLYTKYAAVSRKRKALRAQIQQKYESKGRQKLAEFESRRDSNF